MMTFAERLRDGKEAIVRKWLDAALATYPKDSAAVFERQKDRFANPIGHGLREATQGLFDALLDELEGSGSEPDDERLGRLLHEVVRVRAVQQFSASRGLEFVFRLKQIVRLELGETFAAELVEFEQRVDRMALIAFDLFVACREQISELRINEVKRQVSWVVGKMNDRDGVNEESS